MRKIYLDSCVFVAFLDCTDINHSKVKTFIQKNRDRMDVIFFASSWTLTETLKVLLVSKNWNVDKVFETSENLLRIKRLGDLKFNWLPAPEKNGYDLDDFFYEFQQKIFRHRIGTGDIMHIVLMESCKMDTILTFNTEDFLKFKELTVIQPHNLSRYVF
ncbi:MAG: PIN domain-containing protein [Candidatus Omnitrophica bacterium]|nr:PIN domain-containing protein [Candidatus Omnitrophota bacterium]